MIAAFSESLPRVADTVCTVGASNLTGTAPNCRIFARSRASFSVKSPVIWTDPLKSGVCTTGAEITWPSRMIATCFVGHSSPPSKHFLARAFQTSSPSAPPRRLTLTAQPPWAMSAVASFSKTSPFAATGPTR